MAVRDEAGFIRLIDRKKNLIISGGENIYPAEVEGVLSSHPDVREVAVIGRSDPRWSERVVACVVAKPGASPDEKAIIDWTRDRLAGFKRPREVIFLTPDEMPRNATGKILHRKLRDKLEAAARPPDPPYRQIHLGGAGAEPPLHRHQQGQNHAETLDLNTDEHSVAAWIAHSLKRRGVARVFGLQGGHIQPIWDFIARQGIQIVDVRDEGAAVHMAHAHAELTGELGVCLATAGPGVTNCLTAMANADLSRAPVLLIGGCTTRAQGEYGSAAGHPACRDDGACLPLCPHRPASPIRRCGKWTSRSPVRSATMGCRGRLITKSRPTSCVPRSPRT